MSKAACKLNVLVKTVRKNSIFINKIVYCCVLLIVACSRDDQVFNEYEKHYKDRDYRKVVELKEKALMHIEEASLKKKVTDYYNQSRINYDIGLRLITKADIASKYGFNKIVHSILDSATKFLPNDSLLKEFQSKIPRQKKPVYDAHLDLKSAKCAYTFHTRYQNGKLLPDYVEYTVKNIYNLYPTSVIHFTPNLWYRSGYGYFCLIASEYSSFIRKKENAQLIREGETNSGTLNYLEDCIIYNNMELTVDKVFREIIIGDDDRYYFSLLGYNGAVHVNGLKFVRYE